MLRLIQIVFGSRLRPSIESRFVFDSALYEFGIEHELKLPEIGLPIHPHKHTPYAEKQIVHT